MAAAVNPSARSLCRPPSGQPATRVQGTWNTPPMLTRTARRFSGSQQDGDSSTASMPSAAALRKIAPTFAASTMSSSTAMRRAPAQISSISGIGRRRMAHSTPRVSG